MSALAPTLEAFFSQHLIAQRGASPRIIAAYRDTWRLLLGFASERTSKQPCQLDEASSVPAIVREDGLGRASRPRPSSGRHSGAIRWTPTATSIPANRAARAKAPVT